MKYVLKGLFLFVILMAIPAMAAEPAIKFGAVYRSVQGNHLIVHIYYPQNWKASDKRPALLCYHGGGWVKGTPGHFAKQSQYFSKRGMVTMCFEYRLLKTNAANVADCLIDAKAAYQWVFDHAADLGVDVQKLVLMGGSAGGHLASAVALCPNPDVKAGSLPVKPYAMVLYNPVLDVPEFVGEKDYATKGIDDATTVSSMHHLSKDAPPTLVLHGTKDPVVPFSTASKFIDGLKALGVQATLIPYEDRKHGFFNAKKNQMEDHHKSITDADDFLTGLGLLSAKQ